MDQILNIVEGYMSEWSADHHNSCHIAFESHAYEAILATTNTLNNREFISINNEAQDVLTYFHTKYGAILPYKIQEKMRALKNMVFKMQVKVSSLKKALTALIEDDEKMALMNLSKLRDQPELYMSPLSEEILRTHEEMEELLESHLIDCNSLSQKLLYLLNTLQNAEDSMKLKLDTSRNRLLITNTTFAVYLMAIGFGSYLTGIYGMNLDNTVTIQFVVYGVFETIFVASFSIIIIISASVLYYLRRNYILPKEIIVLHMD
jgi:magnesium transporter